MRKKMKNMFFMVLGFVLTGAVLTGCGESQQSRQDTQQGIPTNISEETGQYSVSERTETDAAEKPAQTSEGYEDNFAVLSLTPENAQGTGILLIDLCCRFAAKCWLV